MENISKNTKIVIILGVLALVFALIGVTYAWFGVNVVNPLGSSMNIEFFDIGDIVFEDGNEIVFSEMYPGDVFSKEFTITKTEGNSEIEVYYAVNLVVRRNTLTAVSNDQFIYSLTGSTDGNGTVINAINQVVPYETVKIGNDYAVINGGETHTYNFTITLNETGSNQNSTRGKGFSGYIEIVSNKEYAYDGVEDNSETLVVNLNGGTTNPRLSSNYITGTAIELPTPVRENHIFMGWTVTGEEASIENNTLIMGSSTTRLTASWYDLNGLVAWYDGINNTAEGHNSEATTWYDSSGNEKTGTLNGGVWGHNYLSFNGTSDWVSLGVQNYDTPTVEIVYEVTAASGTSQYLIANVENGGYGIYVDSNATALVNSIYVTGNADYSNAYTNQITGTKNTASLTYDGSILKEYYNGSEKTVELVTGTIKSPESNTILVLGGNPSGSTVSSGYFNGKIYAVRIYNRALSAEEIEENYQTDKIRFGLE